PFRKRQKNDGNFRNKTLDAGSRMGGRRYARGAERPDGGRGNKPFSSFHRQPAVEDGTYRGYGVHGLPAAVHHHLSLPRETGPEAIALAGYAFSKCLRRLNVSGFISR